MTRARLVMIVACFAGAGVCGWWYFVKEQQRPTTSGLLGAGGAVLLATLGVTLSRTARASGKDDSP